MELVNERFEELKQEPTEKGLFEFIDKCAGVTVNRHSLHEDSKAFVQSLVNRGHLTPLEFGTVYLKVPQLDVKELIVNYNRNFYSKVKKVKIKGVYFLCITTNYRVIVEHNAFKDLKFLTEDTTHHYIRKTVDIHCSRGIADEYARHRTISPLMKSTRYCDELKGGLRFIKPFWFSNAKKIVKFLFKFYLRICSFLYSFFRRCGLKPQEAREILPLCLETELLMCGFVGTSDKESWNRFFKLRCDSAAHPNAKLLADLIKITFYGVEKEVS